MDRPKPHPKSADKLNTSSLVHSSRPVYIEVNPSSPNFYDSDIYASVFDSINPEIHEVSISKAGNFQFDIE